MSDAESSLVQELRELAGVTKKEDDFVVVHGEARIRVVYVGGSSWSVTLRVPYDQHARGVAAAYRSGALEAIRPMKIELLPESDAHRAGKASGMDVEAQTGDPAFDDKVYVDTLTPHAVVVRVLDEPVRRAALDLFAIEFTNITIDDDSSNVIARVVSFASREPFPNRGRLAVDAFARLALGVPHVKKIAGEHRKHPLSRATFWLGISSVVALAACPAAYFGTNPKCKDEMNGAGLAGCLTPGIVGLVVGLVGAIVVALLATSVSKRYRGRSDSSSVGTGFAAASFALSFLLITTAVGLAIAHLL